MQRLLIIYNPHSSRYIDVEKEVLSQARHLKGYALGKFTIKKAPFETNVASIKKILRDGDIVIAAGGDATAAVTANAIMESDKTVTFGVLPYGNFNDLARTLGAKSLDDFKLSEHKGSLKPSKLYPLEILIDGKHWRYATCYVTIGMTAESVELFDEPSIRKNLQKGHKSSWRSYIYLMKWYFKNRHKKQFIPDFTLNGIKQHRKTSDYAAVNGRSMCRVMKGGYDYRVPKRFRSMTDRLTNFWRLFKLMAKSILSRTPGLETTGDKIEFLEPAKVSLQAEGEYHTFKDIKKIEIRKAEKCLRTLEH